MVVFCVKSPCNEFEFFNAKGEKIEKGSFAEFDLKAGSGTITQISFTYMLEFVASEEDMKKQIHAE